MSGPKEVERARAAWAAREAERQRCALDQQLVVPTEAFARELAAFRGTTEEKAAEQILIDKTEEDLLGVPSGELVELDFEIFEGVAEKNDGRK